MIGREVDAGARSSALRFVVLVGIVSLFADATYEGARSIVGPYLALLGASGTVVGVVAGFGELLGYGLRLFSGPLSDRTGRFWGVAWVGYVVQMAAVPLLALAGSWQVAALLIIAERVGKAVRNPPRDAMLAHASGEIGRGWAFGVHEALDQAGAMVGPLAAAVVLALGGSYQAAFAMLLVPALLTIGMLGVTWANYRRPGEVHARQVAIETAGLSGLVWIYVAGAMLVAAGFADFSLMAYHFERADTVAADLVPVLYALAMGLGGLGSLVFGRLFDRFGVVVLVPLTALGAFFAPLVFLGSAAAAVVGIALWGLAMGVHESILAAAVAELVPSARIASAYGLYTMLYGVAWFLGSALMGVLYDRSLVALVVFSVVVQLLAIPLFALVHRRFTAARV